MRYHPSFWSGLVSAAGQGAFTRVYQTVTLHFCSLCSFVFRSTATNANVDMIANQKRLLWSPGPRSCTGAEGLPPRVCFYPACVFNFLLSASWGTLFLSPSQPLGYCNCSPLLLGFWPTRSLNTHAHTKPLSFWVLWKSPCRSCCCRSASSITETLSRVCVTSYQARASILSGVDRCRVWWRVSFCGASRKPQRQTLFFTSRRRAKVFFFQLTGNGLSSHISVQQRFR